MWLLGVWIVDAIEWTQFKWVKKKSLSLRDSFLQLLWSHWGGDDFIVYTSRTILNNIGDGRQFFLMLL